MLIQSMLENSAKKHGSSQAVWFRDSWITYGELNRKANKVAGFLVGSGLTRGDRVALLVENSIEFVLIYFGILKAGGVVVGLNTEITSQDLSYLVNNSDSKFLFIGSNRLRLLTPVLDEIISVNSIIFCGGEASHSGQYTLLSDVLSGSYSDSNPKSLVIDLDLAEIVYTSGSTGTPKGVMLSHLNLVSNMYSIAEYLHLKSDDRMMVVLPFTYIYGKSLLLTHILVGGSLVIDNRFVYPNKVLETMAAMEITGFAGVPSSFSILLNRSALADFNFPKLRYVTQAGGHMATAVQTKVAEAFYPAELYIMYGATEAAPRLSYLEPSMLTEKLGSIGTPVPNVDMFIADEDGNPLSQGQEGEIVARGSNIMMGYWKDPEGTAQVLKKGLYYTGDLGVVDEDGCFFIVGRKKDVIKVKGFRVSAKEIEEKILGLNGVVEAAVIGVPDEILGEAVKAFVVCREDAGISQNDILAHLQPLLSSYKLPKLFEFRSSLPKNGSGKIMKTVLSAGEAVG